MRFLETLRSNEARGPAIPRADERTECGPNQATVEGHASGAHGSCQTVNARHAAGPVCPPERRNFSPSGGAEPEEQTTTGEELNKCAVELGLIIAKTFEDVGWTRRSVVGKVPCIDYVLIQRKVGGNITCVRVHPGALLALNTYVVRRAVSATCVFGGGEVGEITRSNCHERALLRLESTCKNICEFCDTPALPFEWSAETMELALTRYARCCLETCCPVALPLAPLPKKSLSETLLRPRITRKVSFGHTKMRSLASKTRRS